VGLKSPAAALFLKMRSWILVGMMGSGKSSVGRSLAAISERRFVDTDQILVHRIGRPIKQLFSLYGESSFRELEHKILAELVPGADIVSTGGGIVLREDNWTEMRRLGPIAYLRATPDKLIERLTVSKNRRPLLDVENWEDRLRELVAKREPLYEQADCCVDVESMDIDEAAEELKRLLEDVS